MYYDDEDDDDDPYAPRIGPAAMPSPRSKFAPYYSGHANTFEDFLEEYEGLAYDCALTDPQRVDVLIRYVAPSLRDFWRSLSGYHSRDWPLFRQSLVNIFGSTTPRPQVMRQRLLNYVQDSSRCRMLCEDDVLRYYRQFLCYSAPLVHAGHLSEEERDAAFWYGFHPDDCQVLRPRLLGKNPFQPPDIPFHFEVVFSCARAAFAYDDYFPSPWSHAKQFESPSFRRVVEPAPRDTYSSRAVTRAVASNAETTTTPDELPPSLQSPDTQLPSSSSPSVLESHHGLVHSVTLDQPEPTYTLSTTLPPSASPRSHTPSLVHSATDNDLIPAPTFPIFTSTLLPSAFPTPTHTHSLAPLTAADIPEISSTHSLSSTASTPSPMTSISSDFECLSSAMVDQPEFEPEPASLSSITPTSPSLPSTPSLVCVPADDDPEITPTLLPFVHTPSHASSLARSATDNDPISVSTRLSLSTFLPSSARSAMNNKPESEHEAASTSMSVPLSSLPLLTPHPLSPLSSTFLPSPVTSVTEEQPDPEPEPIPLIAPASTFASTPSSSSSSAFLPSPARLATEEPESASTPPITPSSPILLSAPSLASPSAGEVPEIAPMSPSEVPANLAPSPSTFELLPVLPASSDLSSASPPPSLVLGDLELDFSPTPSSAVGTIPRSSPQSFESMSSLHEPIPILPTSLDAPPNAPISPCSTLPQRPPGLKTIGSDSFLLEVTPPLASSVPQQSQELSLVYEASSPRPSLLPLRPLSGPSSVHLNFAFALVSTAFLVSTLLNISKTLSTFARKFWSKYEDIGNNRIGTLNTSSRDVFAQQLRLGQYTPRGTRFVFDPGGPASSSSFKLLSAHEDIRQRKSKTRIGFITTRRATLLALILANNLIVFNPGVAFMLDPAHEDPATFNEDPR
ncbi:hypothetical protein EDB89DRAFT_1389991 [Lactarius sanguifluus]|nr:hypothetical protein EDB89DRAFT_1389991 [Lactarius sanguifluus]